MHVRNFNVITRSMHTFGVICIIQITAEVMKLMKSLHNERRRLNGMPVFFMELIAPYLGMLLSRLH